MKLVRMINGISDLQLNPSPAHCGSAPVQLPEPLHVLPAAPLVKRYPASQVKVTVVPNVVAVVEGVAWGNAGREPQLTATTKCNTNKKKGNGSCAASRH